MLPLTRISQNLFRYLGGATCEEKIAIFGWPESLRRPELLKKLPKVSRFRRPPCCAPNSARKVHVPAALPRFCSQSTCRFTYAPDACAERRCTLSTWSESY